MKRSIQVILVICLLSIVPISTYAEQSTSSTGKHESDLAQVYGAIQAVKYMKEICADNLPKYIKQNETAYQKWRVKYKTFLQEIERHFSKMLWREAGRDPEKHMLILDKYDKILLGYKKGLANLMRNDGEKGIHNTCKIYPVYLTTDRTNLEYFYSEQLVTIRRGTSK